MRSMIFTLGLMVLLLAGNASAGPIWDDGGADHLWRTAENWSPNVVPVAGDIVAIQNSLTPVIDSATNAYAKILFVAADTSYVTGKLTMTGGTLDVVTGRMVLGGNHSTGTFQMDGGTVTITGYEGLRVGDVYSSSVGHLQLDGGIIDTAGFTLGTTYPISGDSTGTADITAGKLVLPGDWRTDQDILDKWGQDVGKHLNEYIADGWLTGYGDPANVVIEYKSDLDETWVTAVPEPSSLVLLIGAVVCLLSLWQRSR